MTAELALARPEHDLTMDTLRAQMEAAKRYVDSGLLPAGIKTPQQALTIMSVGREIGVPPTYALRNIHVIQGRPTCSAELLMALVRRAYGQAAIRVKEASNESCTVEYREAGWDGVSSLTFTLDDAKKANLAGKDMWKAYPRAMLRSRAVSEAVRTAFPECIAGLYTPEEVGARVRVTSEGAVEIDSAEPWRDDETDPERLAPVARIGQLAEPRPSPFKSPGEGGPVPDEITRRLQAWFGTVAGTRLHSDAARAAFVRDWTKDQPRSRQTDSLRQLFTWMTDDEAADLLSHVRALVEAERVEAMRAAAAEFDDEPEQELF